MKCTGAIIGLTVLVVFCGCGVLETINRSRGERDPDSADESCKARVEDADGQKVTKDPLACDCRDIDGRDPKCWGYTEYRDRPMPLPALLSSEGTNPDESQAEPSRIRQAGGPEIPLNGIVNSASFMNRILAAGPIARGSIFTIFGGGIGPAVGVAVTSFPLGTELGGVRIRVFTLDGEVEAIPLFVSAGQINAIMPSDAPLGFVAVEVRFQGQTSNVAPVQVVEAAVGIFTAMGTGDGPCSVTNFVSQAEQPLNTINNPTSPSSFITLWVSGLGAVDGPDNMRPIDIGAVVDVRDRIQLEIYVGSRRVTNIFYAGRSAEFSGLDQIVFQIPADVELGCYTPIIVVANARPSNGVTLATATDGSPCQPVETAFAIPQNVQGVLGSINIFRVIGNSRESLEGPFTDFMLEQIGGLFVRDPPPSLGFSILHESAAGWVMRLGRRT